MPWCPKCKNEYKEGITVCSDCGTELVASLEHVEQSELIKYIFGTEEELTPLYEFLKFGGLKYIALKQEEEAETVENYYLEIDKQEASRAAELSAVYYKELRKKDPIEMPEAEFPEEAEKKINKQGNPVFVKASDKAENYKSSAYALLLVGVLGVIFVILIAAGIIPLSIASNIRVISFVTMMLLFIIFIIMGIRAFLDAKKYAAMSEQEENTTKELQDWFLNIYSADKIDEVLGILAEGTDADEVNYFKRSEFMRNSILEKFGELETGYLEKNIEDLYTELYEH